MYTISNVKHLPRFFRFEEEISEKMGTFHLIAVRSSWYLQHRIRKDQT